MNFSRFSPRTKVSDRILSYFTELERLCATAEVRDRAAREMDLEAGFDWFARRARAGHAAGNSVIFVGNGGSAGIASHQATDFTRNGGIRALALNDATALTCFGNDFGYADVFCRQLEMHGRKGDLLVAISSSGRSENILRSAEAARRLGMWVATFSGFAPDNPLRALGDVNFYVDSGHYGFVELAHLTLIHAILDISVAATETQ